jgi:histone-lysine N-methyltransferase SETMAR
MRRAIQKRRGMLTYGVVFLPEKADSHTTARTRALLHHINRELFDHPSYSSDLASSDYHMFTNMKNWLGSQRFNNNKELTEGVKTWLSSQPTD